MPDLSRTLTEAAADGMAQAIYPAAHAAGLVNQKAIRRWAAAGLARALADLADHFEGLDESDCHPSDTLRRLAGEIREAQ